MQIFQNFKKSENLGIYLDKHKLLSTVEEGNSSNVKIEHKINEVKISEFNIHKVE